MLVDVVGRLALQKPGMSRYFHSPCCALFHQSAWFAAPLAERVDDAAEVGRASGRPAVGDMLSPSPSPVSTRSVRVCIVPSLRASMNSVSPSPVAPAVLEVLAALVAGEEPEADGDAGREEELRRQRDDAVHEVGLDDALADLALAAGVGGERTVGHDEAGDAAAAAVGRREVVDEVLDPGVVGVADGRRAVAPAHVVAQAVARPVARR